mmetsp:Transcript_23217/g.53898  ORF Transcript_23217/g.53898 Transcript_23217/m.53898 type:complete len:108 (+) Transcript_23217:1043-1366(+)
MRMSHTSPTAREGVWVQQEKVAAVGVSASKWITTHGFALNVSPDLEYFDTSCILPCGIDGRGVTSMQKLIQPSHAPLPSVQEVGHVALAKLEKIFGISCLPEVITLQ